MIRARVLQGSLTLWLAAQILCVVSAALAAPVPRVTALGLGEAARTMPKDGKIDVVMSALDGEQHQAILELERFDVFGAQSRIVVVGRDGERLEEPPDNVYLRGSVAGDPYSLVLVTVGASSRIRGLVSKGGDLWLLGSEPVDSGPQADLISRKVDVTKELGEAVRNWSCELDRLDLEASPLSGLLEGAPVPPAGFAGREESISGGSGPSYLAKIAIETDREFFNKFGNVGDAVDYIGDVIAYGSTIYTAEVDTAWQIEVIYLYSSGSDPWDQSSTLCGLFEFGRYWNDNRGNVDRTIAHFMSGKSNGGGVAWRGVLCGGAFNYNTNGAGCSGLAPSVDNYGGGYGYSGQMSGSFNISNPRAVWDMVVVTHEIGHNFNSPHTHDYCNIGGNPQPIDECIPSNWGQSCQGVSGQLPANCPGNGNACGTIMSYCHGLGGTISEISLTLGLGHPYGIEPERVPAVMSSHVQARASSSCLAFPGGSGIFSDDFESGDESAWGLVVTP